MDLPITTVNARDIPDAWFQCLYSIITIGFKYIIDRGSFEGQTRLEFDYITVNIKYPYAEPYDLMLPQIPEHLGIPNPVTNGYIEEYLPYLMTNAPKEGEQYTYGQRMFNQIYYWTEVLKNTPNTNQAVLQVAQPSDKDLSDPPCLRAIDMRVKDNHLIFYPYFRSWDLWCLSEDTEILTKQGWRNIDNITLNDQIATFDEKTDTIMFQTMLGLNKKQYKGNMYCLNTKRIDQLITPNHRVLHKYVTHSGSKRKILDWEYTKAENLKPKDGSYIQLAGVYEGGDLSIGKDLAWLIGVILSDGCFRKNCNTIEIYQSDSKIKYVNKIRKTLDNLNFEYRERITERNYSDSNLKTIKKDGTYLLHCFVIPAKTGKYIKKFIPDKKPSDILYTLKLEERVCLLDGLMLGDGTIKCGRNKTTSYVFYQKDHDTLRWVQLFCFLLGYRTLLNFKKDCLQISTKNKSMIQRIHFNKKELPLQKYNGRVWCVSTPKTNIVIKRNDKISITGNSGLPANLAGIAVLQKTMADEIGVKSGPIIAASKGLHLYGYAEDLAKIRCLKDK